MRRCSKILTLNGKERNVTLNKIAGVLVIFVSPPLLPNNKEKGYIIQGIQGARSFDGTTLYEVSCLTWLINVRGESAIVLSFVLCDYG